ncbi:MAG: indolepyruvate ferredoxin oxidoreductase subunit alpha [Lachnospiraceae bacterium]
MKKLMTGNEAVARGVYEAGIRFAAAYPGTPSTEILENIAGYKEDIIAEWAPNEKVALESAIGFSITGGRAFASMKQVGLNVASDPFYSVAYTGITGGLVIVSADDPGLHSSQTEQDNRYYAKTAKIPMFEPADSQECKDMVLEAVALSERIRMPVLLRMTTRVCHSKSTVDCKDRQEAPLCEYKKDIFTYTTMPAVSKKRRVDLEEKLKVLRTYSEETRTNFIEDHHKKIGIIANGISYQYAKEAFGEEASYMKIGFSYPMPIKKIKEFAAAVDILYVIEETEPYMEEQIRAAGIACQGRELLPGIGELSVGILKEKLLHEKKESISIDSEKLVGRPPSLCAGCPHRPVFYELQKHKNVMVSGDIGCYGLGAMPPLSAVDTILCMGTSVSGGHGMAKAFEAYGVSKRVVSVIGDSTFFHSGMTGLLDVVYNNSKTVTVILDNRITGMTGHQDHPGTGYNAQGDPAAEADIETIVRALGIKHVKSLNPFDMTLLNETLDWALELEEPSVIISRWPCALKKQSQKDKEEFGNYFTTYQVNEELCIGCKLCTKCGCPALRYDKERKKAGIDATMCLGCSTCAQICPKQAITQCKGKQV